jgi:hypothetical protein
MIANPYSAPAAAPGYGAGVRSYFATMQGDVLVVQKQAALPPVCMKCGTQHDIQRRNAKFQWTPMWARMMVVFCTLGGAIAMLLTTKKAQLDVPLCAPCNARWGQAVAAIVGGIVALVLSIFGIGQLHEVGGVLFFVVLAAFIGLMLAFVKPRMLQVHKIDEQNVELKGVHPEAARAIVGA